MAAGANGDGVLMFVTVTIDHGRRGQRRRVKILVVGISVEGLDRLGPGGHGPDDGRSRLETQDLVFWGADGPTACGTPYRRW